MAMVNSGSGKLLRITTFTASGTWTKKDDVGSIEVELVGGGSGGSTGGTTSFGSHLSATGGTYGANISSNWFGGLGGVGSGGDVNINGGHSVASPSGGGFGVGGSSYFGGPGNTTSGGVSNQGAYGAGHGLGGAGGYSRKFILASSLSSTETVTVGTAGTGSVAGPGIVIIREFAK